MQNQRLKGHADGSRSGKGLARMRPGLLAVLLGLGAGLAHAGAQLQIEEILARNAQARGGVETWRKVETLTMSGKMDAGRVRPVPTDELVEVSRGRMALKSVVRIRHGKPPTAAVAQEKIVQLPFSMEMKRGHKVRLELQFDGKTAVQVFDGSHGWEKRPWLAQADAQPYSAQEERMAAQEQELDGFLIDHAAKGTQVSLEGMDKIEGRDAYRLKLTLKGGEVRHVWLDAGTFLEIQIDGKRRMDGKDKPVFTVLKDYRKVDGVLLPFATETRVEGVPDAQRIVLEHVAVNEAVADMHFLKP